MTNKVYTTDHFFYNKETKTFVTEASSLTGKNDLFYKVYNPATRTYQNGLSMMSTRTKKIIDFAVHITEYNSENDVIRWLLVPIVIDRNIHMHGVSAIVYNT